MEALLLLLIGVAGGSLIHTTAFLLRRWKANQTQRSMEPGQPDCAAGVHSCTLPATLSDEGEVFDFEIRISDWGEEFTGENGTLHRWRWSIWPKGGSDPVWLGNAATQFAATQQGCHWICETQGQGRSVSVRHVS